MKGKLAFVAPYDKLRQIVEKITNTMGIDLLTYTGDLEEGILCAKEAVEEGAKIIISRGGTAKEIRKAGFTVVELKVTGYDLLRVIYKYYNKNIKIAVIGYDNVVFGAKSICNIMNMDISFIPINDEQDLFEKINYAKEKNIDVIIGDTIAVKKAKEAGFKCDLIESGEESIINAINESIELYKAVESEKIKRQRYQIILESIQEGVIAVDKEDKIILFNYAAEKIIGTNKDKVMNKKTSEIIKNSRINQVLKKGEPELNCIQNLETAIVATNRVPIIVDGQVFGAVATFQDITKIQELEKRIRFELSEKGLTGKYTFDDILGESSIMKKTIEISKKYSLTDSTILLTGETGTGKEIFAQSIHNYSKRSNGPFVAVNCAAISKNLLESELFGYTGGAFTGARKEGKKGLFELAHKGTIFLDEITEMDLDIQSRLLRVIQEKEIMKIGSDRVIPIDVRIIAASNKNLKELVRENKFRSDLYYRINVLKIDIPPLRSRKEDIKILAEKHYQKYTKKYLGEAKKLEKRILKKLEEYSWPGNVRELINITEKMAVVGNKNILDDDFSELIFNDLDNDPCKEKESLVKIINLGKLEDIEKAVIEIVLKEEGYNKTNTAKRLGITRTTLNSKLSK